MPRMQCGKPQKPWLTEQRAIVLPVSAPFHSTLMQPAADRLAEVLDQVKVPTPRFGGANVTAQPEQKGDEIRKIWLSRLPARYLWEDSVRYMIQAGVTTFIEVGPGKVLTGFVKKIDRSFSCGYAQDWLSLEKLLLI